MENRIEIDESQRTKLMKLWFIYGNNGKKHTHHNHRYIQNIIEHGEDTEEFYKNASKDRTNLAKINWNTIKLTDECVDAVKAILNDKQQS